MLIDTISSNTHNNATFTLDTKTRMSDAEDLIEFPSLETAAILDLFPNEDIELEEQNAVLQSCTSAYRWRSSELFLHCICLISYYNLGNEQMQMIDAMGDESQVSAPLLVSRHLHARNQMQQR